VAHFSGVASNSGDPVGKGQLVHGAVLSPIGHRIVLEETSFLLGIVLETWLPLPIPSDVLDGEGKTFNADGAALSSGTLAAGDVPL
jgi:hypothetical protein